MHRIALLIGLWTAMGSFTFAQESAAQIAARQEAAERDRLMRSELEELRQSFLQQQRRINDLINENSGLQRQLSEMDTRFRTAQASAITRKDLEKIVESLKEVDRNRLADRSNLQDQIKEVAKVAATKPAPVIIERPSEPPPSTNRTPTHDNDAKTENDEPVRDNPNGYYTHKVKNGENLTLIINAFNDKLKDQNKARITIDQVKKANPKLNPNKMIVGQEIQIPIPPNK